MTNYQRQRGASLWSWLLIVLVLGFFGLLGLKLGPVYMNHYKVNTVLNSLAEQPNMGKASRIDIHKMIAKRFNVDSVDHIKAKDVKVEPPVNGGKRHVSVEYEVRTAVTGSVDVLNKFSEKIQIYPQ